MSIEFKVKAINKEERITELMFLVNNINILEFEYNGKIRTTRWNNDDLIKWLNESIIFLENDKQFPYLNNCDNNLNSIQLFEKYINKDPKNLDIDTYLDTLDDWIYEHSWHHESSGAILANLVFRKVDNNIEISWDNKDNDAKFTSLEGTIVVSFEEYRECIRKLLVDYSYCIN